MMHHPALTGGMIPLDQSTSTELLRTALYNCGLFNLPSFRRWLQTQSAEIQQLAARCMPNRLYRVQATVDDLSNAAQQMQTLYAVVVGYRRPTAEYPALCVVQILGVQEGAGSFAEPLTIGAGLLEDVTDDVRKEFFHDR